MCNSVDHIFNFTENYSVMKKVTFWMKSLKVLWRWESGKKISDSRNKFEDLIQMAKNSEQGMNFLYSSLPNLVVPLQKITPATRVDEQDEYESFLGNRIPTEVDIHPPNDIRSKGRSKRIRKSKEPKTGSGSKVKNKRKCRKCKQVADHDARNCPNNVVG